MVSVIQQPQTFTPSNNPIIFQIESDEADIVSFNVEVMEAVSEDIIWSGNFEVRPDYLNGAVLQLNRILSNVVTWEINNDYSDFVVALEGNPVSPVLSYKLRITERLVSGAVVSLGEPFTTTAYYVWEAEMNEFLFEEYVQEDYVIPAVSIGLPTYFLTNKPNNAIVSQYSSEQLYFLHEEEDDLSVIIKTYSPSNVLIQTYTLPVTALETNKMFRVHASPWALLGSGDIVVPFDLSNLSYYTIHIEDETSEIKTETRTYHYRPEQCNNDAVNLIWVNSLGGVDAYQFVNATPVQNIDRNIIQKNPYRFNNGIYSNKTGNDLNVMEQIINVNKSASYTAYSKFITDAEGEWLNELFISKQVFVELVDRGLIPVSVSNNSYAIQKQRLNISSYNSISVTYTYKGDLIPLSRTLLGLPINTVPEPNMVIDSDENFITFP